MGQNKVNENSFDKTTPLWRETPLDHWSSSIDPVIMSGDEWVKGDRDPGAERIHEQQGGTVMRERFMHPMHDTAYGLDDDIDMAQDEP